MNKRPTCIDLFCGAGGMSLGFEEAGFDVVAGVELDPVHANVHTYNFPDCTVYRQDIAELTGDDLKNGHGEIDVVIGGPPCQGFSLIGKREETDERNGLVMEYMRIVSEVQPKYFVMLCLFRLRLDGDTVRIVDEKHYKLTLSGDIDMQDIIQRNLDQIE